MKSDCYFAECTDCEFRDCNNDTMICLTNRLNLAFYKLCKELPIINKFMKDYKGCYGFVTRGENYEQNFYRMEMR